MNPLTFEVMLSAGYRWFIQHRSMSLSDLLLCFCLFLLMLRFPFSNCFTSTKTFFFFSLLFSMQSSEQKQTPVSPGASLPVQPQTRTTVSTPFLFFHLHIQRSYAPLWLSLITLSLSPFLSLLMCYTIHLKTWPRCNVRTSIQVEGSSPAPGDTVPLCAPVERWKKKCVRMILEGKSVPEVNVLFGPVRNFYSGVRSFPRVFRVWEQVILMQRSLPLAVLLSLFHLTFPDMLSLSFIFSVSVP